MTAREAIQFHMFFEASPFHLSQGHQSRQFRGKEKHAREKWSGTEIH